MNDQFVQSSQSESQAQLIEQGKCCCLRAGRMLLRSFSPTHVRRKLGCPSSYGTPTAGHVILNQMPNGNRLRAMRSQNGDHVARVGHKHNTIHSSCVRASPARLHELASDRSVQMQLHTRPPVAGGFIYKTERRGGVEQNLASYAPPRLQSCVQTTTNWYKRKKPSPFTRSHISTLVLVLSPSPSAEGISNSLG
jgi:hypothetical protein